MNKILKFILCFLITLSSIITVIDFNCFDYGFYEKESRELNTASEIGVSDEDLDLMFYDLLDYMKGKRENLDLQVKINGSMREVYNEREKTHMIDVKDLYDKAILVRNISLVISLLIVIYLLFKKDLNNLLPQYINSLKIYGFVCAFIGLFCIFDFNAFWMNFHKVFFTKNDFWLLDPRTDILINMVPEKFFLDLVSKIVIEVVIVLVLFYFILKLFKKKENR